MKDSHLFLLAYIASPYRKIGELSRGALCVLCKEYKIPISDLDDLIGTYLIHDEMNFYSILFLQTEDVPQNLASVLYHLSFSPIRLPTLHHQMQDFKSDLVTTLLFGIRFAFIQFGYYNFQMYFNTISDFNPNEIPKMIEYVTYSEFRKMYAYWLFSGNIDNEKICYFMTMYVTRAKSCLDPSYISFLHGLNVMIHGSSERIPR